MLESQKKKRAEIEADADVSVRGEFDAISTRVPGIEISELFPHLGECADDMCVIRSLHTDIPNHEPSMNMMNTGHTQVVRYTTAQDAGRAIHPSYVEGQLQGGVVQGIGWALNEEYVYRADGTMDNPSFLDYRIPVASDLPMIDAVIVEVPNPGHPYGVRGVGEVGIVPPLAAVANAVAAATGKRFTDLPLSPPRVLDGILNGTDAS